MGSWKGCNLEDVAVFQMGHDLPRSMMKNGDIPVAGSNGIIGYHNEASTKDQRRTLADRMKPPDDELKLIIVRDMWLTGFDVPSLHTLCIDKPMSGHNLMQAIARVNRVFKDKPGGLVVDYLGIASDLKKALSFYSASGGKGDPAVAQEKAVEVMLENLEIVSQMFAEKPAGEYSQDFKDLMHDPLVPYLGKDKGLLYEEYSSRGLKETT